MVCTSWVFFDHWLGPRFIVNLASFSGKIQKTKTGKSTKDHGPRGVDKPVCGLHVNRHLFFYDEVRPLTHHHCWICLSALFLCPVLGTLPAEFMAIPCDETSLGLFGFSLLCRYFSAFWGGGGWSGSPRFTVISVRPARSPFSPLKSTLRFQWDLSKLDTKMTTKKSTNDKWHSHHELRCLGTRDSNHDPLANRIASESNRAIWKTPKNVRERERTKKKTSQRFERTWGLRFESFFFGVPAANQTKESEVRENFGEGVRNELQNPLIKRFCIVFTSKREFRNSFRTPSPKFANLTFFGLVCQSHSWFKSLRTCMGLLSGGGEFLQNQGGCERRGRGAERVGACMCVVDISLGNEGVIAAWL